MSKPSQRPLCSDIKAQRRKKNQQEKALRDRHREAGLASRTAPALPNTCSAYATIARESGGARGGRHRAAAYPAPRVAAAAQATGEDSQFSRNPRKCRHRLAVPLLLLDGLYTNGPVMRRCRQLHWQFMIVLKDRDLPTVWEEFESLTFLRPESSLKRTWGDRHQRFFWVNAIEYEFTNAGRQRLGLHVVVCEETWQMVHEHGETVTKTARHAWLSSRPLDRRNVHERCNLGARYRWGIEAGFLVEKHQGYHYEHAFALNWNAMKGNH